VVALYAFTCINASGCILSGHSGAALPVFSRPYLNASTLLQSITTATALPCYVIFARAFLIN
jgi:hypothetical protein